ncbi:MAG: helix-turn-helix transcriptional regulator [Pseudonocardiales bacterium]|nr:helix-turn-helix transcriptional regulator [Pseudonocardiales bacterium]
MSGTEEFRAESTIGERIRRLRKKVGMTQDELAAAAGVSTDLIRKLEQGQRHTASLASLSRIARALGVSIAALLGPAPPAASAEQHQPQIIAIRDALTSVDDILGELDDVDAPDLAELAHAVAHAWGMYWACRYTTLAAMLPRLLTDTRAATHAATAAEAGRAADLAAQVHQITARTLVQFDKADLGHVAAREALRLAGRAGDPLRLAAVREVLGFVLVRQGRYDDAERVAVVTATQLEPTGQVSTAHWSVYGGLLLRRATSAARQGRSGTATDLLTEAAEATQQTGGNRIDYDLRFGPSFLVMQSTDCAVVTGDYVAAAEASRRMPRGSALPLVSRSRHLADVAHAQLRLGRIQAAESTLLTMERAAPEWTALHRLPRVLVGELLTRGRPSTRLRELAQRLHAAPAPRGG